MGMGATGLLAIDEALQTLLAVVRPLGVETLPLAEALGRTLAEDLRADLDQPPFDRSAMDGVALRSADVRDATVTLLQIGTALAGTPFSGEVLEGTCVRIMTGAVVPRGADAVVPVELLTSESHSDGRLQVTVRTVVQSGQHIARQGSEVRAGAVVLRKGTLLTSARLGVAAAFGHATVTVARRPRVALVPTGDELVAIDTKPGPGQIRDSNRYALAAALQSAGAEVLHGAVATDDRDALRSALAAAWQQADLLVTCGGVSAGDLDLVAPVLQDLGATCHFHKIAIKPGKPLLCASRGAQLAIGLPGNPVSAWVCAQLFVLPALAAMQGQHGVGWQRVEVPTAHAMPAVGPRTEVLPAQWTVWQGLAAVATVATQGSADLPAFAQGDVLLLRPAASTPLAAGDRVQALWWPRPL
jgi:molybdopterin molybdotransferase